MSAPDPTPDVPVFRVTADTTELAPADRYRLATRCALIEEFRPPPAPPASRN